MPEDDSEYQEMKRELELDKSLYPKKEDRDKNFYNLYQFIMNGFFFVQCFQIKN